MYLGIGLKLMYSKLVHILQYLWNCGILVLMYSESRKYPKEVILNTSHEGFCNQFIDRFPVEHTIKRLGGVSLFRITKSKKENDQHSKYNISIVLS